MLGWIGDENRPIQVYSVSDKKENNNEDLGMGMGMDELRESTDEWW